jgi:hypothetical protein
VTERYGTAAQWTAWNGVLASGDIGEESDTGRRKTGDGATAWTSLAYRNSDTEILENKSLGGTCTVFGAVLATDDAHFALYNQADSSKTLVFDLSGISPSSARVVKLPDANGIPVYGVVNGTETALILWTGTQAQYDAISSKDAHTVYVITA